MDCLIPVHILKCLLKCRYNILEEQFSRRSGTFARSRESRSPLLSRAGDFLHYLSKNSRKDLTERCILDDDGALQDTMFIDLTRYWIHY